MVEIVLLPRKQSLGFKIYQTGVHLKAGLRRAFQKRGLYVTPEQWSVLGTLWNEEGIHQSLLAEKTDNDRHNITRILDLLEKQDLIRRKPDQHDKRRQRVYLTDAGKKLEIRLAPIVTEFLRKAFQGLTEEELTELKHILNQIQSNLGDSPDPNDKVRAAK